MFHQLLFSSLIKKIFEGLKRVIHDAISRKDGIKILMEYVDDIIVVNFLLKGLFFSRDNNPQLKFNINSRVFDVPNGDVAAERKRAPRGGHGEREEALLAFSRAGLAGERPEVHRHIIDRRGDGLTPV